MTPLLEVKNLKKYFPVYSGILRHQVGSIKAVDGIDLTLFSGEILGLVGESGAGKSTVGRVALYLLKPTEGRIIFEEKDVALLNRQELMQFRRQAQIVFQNPYASLNPRRSILDSIGEALIYHGYVQNRREMKEAVEEILCKVGLDQDIMFRYPHQLSGGQQQRVCIGRAISLEPRLIVCDEAVSSLDVSVQAQILNLLKDLQTRLNLSYLFITHDLSVVRIFCDRVIVMYQGKIVEVARVQELFHNPKHPYTRALLSAIPKDHPRYC